MPEQAMQPSRRRPGLWLMIIGGLLAIGFGLYAAISASTPLWIVAGWGVLVFLYGLFRTIRGASPLDNRRGGTDANGL